MVLYLFGTIATYILGMWFFCLVPVISYMLIDFSRKRKFYQPVIENSNALESKYQLASIIENPDFLDGRIFYEVLYDASKSMYEQVNTHKQAEIEYREYIERWVHEIKTPIAAIHLLLENNGNKSEIIEEISYIDNYIQQVLYYARSQYPENDFFVKEFDISTSIHNALKKYGRRFIASGMQLRYKPEVGMVFADSKWTQYIIEQLISNAIKYAQGSDCKLLIYGEEGESNYTLTIEDTGVGIVKKDLKKVFNKGFTGENGRVFGQSTGMGLYICKSLCDKLYIGLEIQSEQGSGTKAILTFPKYSLFAD